MPISSPEPKAAAPVCSFCGRPNTLVGRLIAGPGGANICNDCVATCADLLKDADTKSAPANTQPDDPSCDALAAALAALAAHKAAGNAHTAKRGPVDASASPADAANADVKKPAGVSVVEPKREPLKPIKLIPPHEIRAVLDDFVIGQEQAKKVLSVAVYNHYKRLNALLHGQQPDEQFSDLADIEVEKSNILLLGPTGSGKTLLARTLARVLDVPFAIADATTVTEAGYVGEDVESIVQRLLAAANFDIPRAQTGIIYIDEIDKLALKGDSPHVSRNLGQGVQHALLKIIEGCVCNIPPQGGRKHPEQQYVQLDTTNILFICGGAFVGLDEIIGRRVGNRFLGFDTASSSSGEALTAAQIMENLQPEDLFDFGLIPEFVGRLPVVSALSELSREDLERVLLEPKNALLKQYRKLLALEGVKLTFRPDAVSAIAAKALGLKTGARGLRSIIERMILSTMYELPQRTGVKEVVITEAAVLGKEEPLLETSPAETPSI
ncbi:MAG: ATP-dependent Clp protease ATP-binding subunit ClpX [Puniceicoccales bacterium]|nr:ATP-dependent Clp protease ATP-binding subunit ClpX [Puniceicoccales bacterium]